MLDRESGLPEELAQEDLVYFIYQLPRPSGVPDKTPQYILLLEYEKEVPVFVENIARLMGGTMAEALLFHRLSGRKGFPVRRQKGRRIFWLVLLMLIIGAMFIRVPESTTAEFTLQPEAVVPVYAKFDGSIVEYLREDGSSVAAGEVIARYDTAVFQYRLQQSQSALAELEAEIALEEAKNAKSEVRLTRDSEGNFGYVYTANQDNVASATQNYLDAQNELYNIGLENSKAYREKTVQLQQSTLEELKQLEIDFRVNHIISEEQYNQ
jgi:multidrug resistance efflux pump